MRNVTRRRALGAGAAAAAATTMMAAGVRPRSARAAATPSAGGVILGLIGAGGRGHDLATGFSRLPGVRFRYVCDVDATRGTATMKALENQPGGPPKRVADLRQLLDDRDVHAVIVATPDHWHALATVWACQAGKDVYVEKNLALSVWEGRKMVEAARKYDRVVQAGFQMRSAPYSRSARQYIADGGLGKVVSVRVYNLLSFAPWKPAPDAPAPPTLDWDRWLGPAAAVPYNPGRSRGWYFHYDYCGGDLGNDGSHQLDLLRMVLGDPAGPRSVTCVGGNLAWGSQRPVPEVQEATFDYGDLIVTVASGAFTPYLRKSNREERYGEKWPNWQANCERIEIYGTKRMMMLGRHGVGWQALEADGKVVAQEKGKHPDPQHQADFVDAIRTRRKPNADVEEAHRSGLLAHLANIAFRTGRGRLEWDAAAERFKSDDAANALLRAPMREGYRIGGTI